MSARALPPAPPRAWAGMARVTTLQCLALLPPVAAVAVERGSTVLPVLGTVLLVTLVWEMAFCVGRALPLSWHGIVTALTLTVILPPSLPIWQVALTTSFGIVLGEEIFGGRGFGFLNAGVVAGTFVTFAFPGTALAGAEPMVAWATVPGLVLLIATGLLPWRVLAGTAAAMAAGPLTEGEMPAPETIAALTFGAVFLIADPFATAATSAGRWLTGALAGLLALHLGAFSGPEAAMGAIVSAALVASLAAPLVDYVAILAHTRRRRWRQSRV